MASRPHLVVLAHATALAALAVPGCTSGGDDAVTVADYVTGVTTADGAVHATYVAGALPGAGAGPSIDVATNAAVIPGGTAPALVTADGAFSTVVIGIDGADGYYLVSLPSAGATAELVVTLSQELIVPAFDWVFGAGTAAAMGSYTITPTTVVDVGTGDVQVSLSWNSAADVDLHVFDPADEEIYWAHRESASGGALDLDSNAACGSDGPRNENITWPVGRGPLGAYRVQVDYWSNCDATATDFTVAVNVEGEAPRTFSGAFTGSGDLGGAGAGEPITTFTVGGAAAAPGAAGDRQLGTIDVHHVPGAPIYRK